MDVGCEFEGLSSSVSPYGGFQEEEDTVWRSLMQALYFFAMLPLYAVLAVVLVPVFLLDTFYNFVALLCYAVLISAHHMQREHPQIIEHVSAQLRSLLFGRPTSIDFIPTTVTRNHGS